MYKSTWLLVACLFVLVSCAESANQGTVPVATAHPTSVPTPTATPTTIPPVPALGPVPHNCPLSHPGPHSISPNLAPVIGTSPVWATWLRDFNTFHPPPPGPLYPNSYIPPYGWLLNKVIWEVGPHYTHLVTIRGHDLFDHTPLLFQFLDNTPTADVVLDPQHPNHPVSVIGTNWAEWGSDFVAPKAGCYIVDVSWPTGHWSITFAVGA
jgi:hypothetical protein